MTTQPSGTVTLLFSDIEGSTRLLERLGTQSYAGVLEQHRRVLRDVFDRHEGYEVDTEGDSFFVAFARAGDAVAAAAEAQTALSAVGVRVRIGLHTGAPLLAGSNYVGLDVHRAARIMSAGHGGQVLLSPSTRELVGELEVRDLGLHRLKDFDAPVRLFQLGTDDFPSLKTLDRTNLPLPASSFVGREREVGEVTSLLREPRGRLVTLTGPGGSGKTRLAIEAAGNVVGDYPDGVFWAGLASLRESELVLGAIAQSLDANDGVAGRIGDRSLLLVLDNFEHVIEAAAELSSLLAACHNLQLLVTSRELLRLQGEIEFPVPPLEAAEAEELFCTRAQLAPDGEIAELCRHLDDLPLAVELAAARTAVLSPGQIRERLAQRLDLFRGGRDADPRQQTLRATIEWSFELLTESEKQLFARLSIFAGGCSFEAAEDVAGADLDELQSLVDKSLVRHTGERFWMLETIGELARERLAASSELHELGRTHADYFLALAERAEPGLKGGEQPAWLQRLEADHDNFRAALEWFLAHRDPERALRLSGSLWLFWYMHGHVSEARRWLARSLDAAPAVASEPRATALDGAGYLAAEQYDRSGVALIEESLACAKQVGATAAAAIAAAHLCGVQGEFLGADDDPEPLLAIGAEAIELARAAGDDYVLGIAFNNLGVVYRSLGDNDQAAAHYEAALEVRRRTGDVSRIALSLHNLAWVAYLSGDLGRAADLYAEALELATGIGDKRHMSFATAGLSDVAFHEQRWDDADANNRESLRLASELGSTLVTVNAIGRAAALAAVRGDPVRSARLAAVSAASDVGLQQEHVGLHAQRMAIDRAKSAVDPELWQRAWVEGTAMSLDDAVAYALAP